jgi:hypothetical protein
MSNSRQSARRLRKKNSGAADRHRALALFSQFGHTEIVRMLLDAAEDPRPYNPVGCHSHSNAPCLVCPRGTGHKL